MREDRTFQNMCLAIDMQEIFERVSIKAHGSFLPHGAVFKTTRDILRVADVHAFRLLKLELHNAHTKRTATNGASRTLELRDSGKARAPLQTLERRRAGQAGGDRATARSRRSPPSRRSRRSRCCGVGSQRSLPYPTAEWHSGCLERRVRVGRNGFQRAHEDG